VLGPDVLAAPLASRKTFSTSTHGEFEAHPTRAAAAKVKARFFMRKA
jgi:hypothetical protein